EISENIKWVPIKSIEKSSNYTYDFSLPDDIKEENDFHHSVIYNSIIGHQTPNSHDEVFYKIFDAAKNGQSKFVATEIYWWEDPRYNQDLKWVKGESIIETKDPKIYKELIKGDYEATSTWFEDMCREYNGD